MLCRLHGIIKANASSALRDNLPPEFHEIFPAAADTQWAADAENDIDFWRL